MAVKKTKNSVWHEVTPFSKFLALTLFVLLPVITFWIGINKGMGVGYELRRAQEVYDSVAKSATGMDQVKTK